MRYLLRFAFPWSLTLLVMLPWAIWLGAKIRSLPTGRKWTAIALRAIILLCLIGALAGAEVVKKNDRLAVFFLLDQSNSIPVTARPAIAQQVRNLSKQYMTSRDEAGVIVFGEQSSIELSVGPTMELGDTKSYVGGEQTDMAAAIRLAMAAFPQGYMKRIVIFSDGNETVGSAGEEAKVAKAAGVAIDVVPLNIRAEREVRIREVIAPTQAKAGEPFQVKIVAHSLSDADGVLRFYQRGKEGKRLIAEQKVALQKGDNAYLLTQELGEPGFYEYEATLESDSDTILANNIGRAFTIVHGEPRALYVDGERDHGLYLEQALQSSGLKIDRITPADMPDSLARLQNYDAIIMANVSATDLSAEQNRTVEALVRDMGVGLVMIGGPDSFGAGGFLGTPIEKALPVDMDIKQRKVLPRGALVLVMHTCEIMDGNMWAREIGLASLNVLASQDLMGALGYMYGGGNTGSGYSWIYELQPVGDKTMMRRLLTRGSTQIGDMPDVAPTLQMAYNALKNADAAVKRVVVISDGDPAAPSASLLKQIAAAKISVSTVCIAPHSPNDQNMLSWIAQSTGGQYYYVTNPNNLPQIFSKEAATVKRGLMVEKPFVPKPHHISELLTGIDDNALPRLLGYVVTSPKDKATVALVSDEGDPVLAHWRYGLGKSVAFTSDATNRWAADWLGWPGFSRFWRQAVRWAMRETGSANFQVETRMRDGMGYVKIDAMDDEGRFLNYLKPRGAVTGPPPDFARQDLKLMQTGPGIYEAAFPVSHAGVYMMNITYTGRGGATGMIPAGLALSYSREYDYASTNRALLENIAEITGGRVLNEGTNPFEHSLKTSSDIGPIWQFLALLAVCLFPIEIFVRRVVFDLSAVYARAAQAMQSVPLLRRVVTVPAARTRVVTGMYRSAKTVDIERKKTDSAQSFGLTVDETKTEKIVIKDTKAKKTAAEGRVEYTSKLLEAKKKATARKGDSANETPDKEEK